MRIMFFGTPQFAVPTLQALIASPHEVVGVVTQIDRPRGRGQKVGEPPVKTVARDAGIPVWQPERLKTDDWLAVCRTIGAEIGVVAAYGKILPQVLLDLFPRGMVNVHASLLPKYRGASPIQHAVMHGDAETGVTIMRVVLALDAGPMIATASRAIGRDETADEVEQGLSTIGATLLVATLDDIAMGRTREVPQDDSQATYAPRLTKEDGVLDWTLDAARIHDRIRGLRPWPRAYSSLDGHRVTLLRGSVVAEGLPTADAPGTIVEARGDRLVVAAGASTSYRVLELQPDGRRAMTAREFLAGHAVAPGARFSRPTS